MLVSATNRVVIALIIDDDIAIVSAPVPSAVRTLSELGTGPIIAIFCKAQFILSDLDVITSYPHIFRESR